MKRVLVPLGLALLLFACRDDLGAPAGRSNLDEPFFRCKVQPVMTKNCAMLACHGDDSRYFRQYGRNRLRSGIVDESKRNAQLSTHERSFNYEAARAFVDPDAPDESLLLKKVLPPELGGYYHGGTRYGGGNVFSRLDDPEYTAIAEWIHGKTEAPTCIAPGDDQ